jgi:nucleotide-binding universal stress UspA family protein
VKTSVWYGSAAPSILEAAHMTKPDLIMMSTHGRSGLSRLASGRSPSPCCVAQASPSF